jgi:peptide/nickel transport system ATP-binding protein
MAEKRNITGQAPSSEYLLEVRHLCKFFNVNKSLLRRQPVYLRAVDDVSFCVKAGETLGIVGESGCGKSTLGNTIIRLLDATSGQVLFNGKDFTTLQQKELQAERANIQMVFQDPFSSLNPRMRVFDIIAEPFRTHHVCSGPELREAVFQLMDEVGLPRTSAFRFPHEFSGGQRQRIGIARALALKPKLIICDEPVSALDVSIQAQILNLLAELQKKFNLTYIFIAHGMPTVKHISTNVAVMYLGKIMEFAPKKDLFSRPLHPYTEGLLRAVPIPDPTLRDSEGTPILSGDVPSPVNPPSGCRFRTRCPYAQDRCREEAPELTSKDGSPHLVACHYPLENGQGILH